MTEIHRPNGVSTYNTYNARNQIVTLKNTCNECGWVISQYDYTYDKNGYIAFEKAVESLYSYAWDNKHNGKHEDGRLPSSREQKENSGYPQSCSMGRRTPLRTAMAT